MDEEQIRSAAWSIPRGRWASYGDVAERIGHPGAARAVARTMLAINGVCNHPSEAPLPVWRIRLSNGRMRVPPSHHPDRVKQARYAAECDRLLDDEGGAVIDGRATETYRVDW